MKLFPRLPLPVAKRLAGELADYSIEACRASSSVTHRSATFAAVGGRRVTEKELEALAERVRQVARESGYPERPPLHRLATFEARCAAVLLDEAEVTPTEAAREGVWAFFACVLLPDIVRWRWGGNSTPIDRFLGGERGLRNTLGRLWWRAYMLEDRWWSEKDRHELLHVLSEDQIVGFVERPRAFQSPLVAVAICREVIRVRRRSSTRGQEVELMRDVTRRVLRLGAFLSYESLSADEMRETARRVVEESLRKLGRPQTVVDRAAEPERDAREYEPTNGTESLADLPASRGRRPRPARPPQMTFESQLNSTLSGVDLSSTSPNRLTPLKKLLADELGLSEAGIRAKYVGGAKNGANRIGEALRARPELLVVLVDEDTFEKLSNAIRSRWAAFPSSSILVVVRNSRQRWSVAAGFAPEPAEARRLHRLLPASAIQTGMPDAPGRSSFDTEGIAHALSEQFARHLRLTPSDPVAAVRKAVAEAGAPNTSIRTKRINDGKNVGNRISEGLGAGCEVLLISVPEELRRTVEEEAERQLRAASAAAIVVVVTIDADGRASRPSVTPGAYEGAGPGWTRQPRASARP